MALSQADIDKIPDAALLAEFDRRERIAAWAQDPLKFGQEMFPNHFSSSAARFHPEMVKEMFPINAAQQQPAPYHYILIISNTADQAIDFLKPIKLEWESNRELRRNFPHIKPNKDKWGEEEIEFIVGQSRTRIKALGSGAQLRGRKFLNYRPDLIIIDDGENDEMVESEDRRKKFQWWLDHVVLLANANFRKVALAAPREFAKSTIASFLLPMWGMTCASAGPQLVMVGTILHQLSQLNRIIRQPEDEDKRLYNDWSKRLYVALDEHDQSNWPEKQPTEQLHAHRIRDPFGFAQEKMNDPVDQGICPFKVEFFGPERFYEKLPEELTISITLDPACTDKEYSDETAMSVAGWDNQSRLWVIDSVHGKFVNPTDILDLLFNAYQRWGVANQALNPGHRFHAIGIEGVAFQKFLIHLFQQRCERERVYPFVQELKGDMKKVRRILQLEPLFRENRIFLRPDMQSIESQLKAFRPDGKYDKDDRIDALAYHLSLWNLHPIAPKPEESGELVFHEMTMGEYHKLCDESAEIRQHMSDPEDYLAFRQARALWPLRARN